MPEFQVATIEATEAEQAVHYVLARVVNDRNFSWYMWYTQSMRLCLIAEAKRLGISETELEQQLHQASIKANLRLALHGADKSDVCVMQTRLDRIDEKLRDLFDAGKLDKTDYDPLYNLINP